MNFKEEARALLEKVSNQAAELQGRKDQALAIYEKEKNAAFEKYRSTISEFDEELKQIGKFQRMMDPNAATPKRAKKNVKVVVLEYLKANEGTYFSVDAVLEEIHPDLWDGDVEPKHKTSIRNALNNLEKDLAEVESDGKGKEKTFVYSEEVE